MRCKSFVNTKLFNENLRLHNTPIFSEFKFIPSYFSGYVDGEGCFCISISKSRRNKLGWEVRPSFSVSQNKERSEVLYMLKGYFGCGSIRADNSDSTVKYEVRSLRDLLEKVIPHFDKYKLLSSKIRSFVVFKEVCQRMGMKNHLSKNGLEEIILLSGKVNFPSKRKYQGIKI